MVFMENAREASAPNRDTATIAAVALSPICTFWRDSLNPTAEGNILFRSDATGDTSALTMLVGLGAHGQADTRAPEPNPFFFRRLKTPADASTTISATGSGSRNVTAEFINGLLYIFA